MKVINVSASKNYEVIIDNGFENFKSKVLPLLSGEKVAIITDSNVGDLYYDTVKNLLDGKTVYKLVIKAGEKSKNFNTYKKLILKLSSLSLSRKDAIIGLGGGVVGDIAGFVSSTYMRGINYVSIPTSLLAMVDSSVGGKTGVDLPLGKNLLGTFYQPSAVYINLSLLKTLPAREILCGKGEIIKYAFLDSRLSAQDIKVNNYSDLVYKCVEIKKDIVESDEKESGKRKLLNFGHTFGHALEKLYKYKLSHGECVIKGMYYSLEASKKLNLISEVDYNNAVELLKSTGVTKDNKFNKNQIFKIMKTDKKSNGENVDFVFSKGFYNPEIRTVSIKSLLE